MIIQYFLLYFYRTSIGFPQKSRKTNTTKKYRQERVPAGSAAKYVRLIDRLRGHGNSLLRLSSGLGVIDRLGSLLCLCGSGSFHGCNCFWYGGIRRIVILICRNGGIQNGRLKGAVYLGIVNDHSGAYRAVVINPFHLAGL